ncbi:MAG: DUF4857 domain-containing protein [Candidatus Marinimicrobia bacterium]|nr:DUF4857 domain-containing protein [Candidatus Neomarinimicrobiota bacterium]
MLNKLSRYIIIGLIVIVAALYLPDFFSMLFDKKVNKPRLDYSAVIDEFVIARAAKMKKTEYRDINGNTYSEREFFKLLPFTYYASLEKWQELMPELKGFKLTPRNIRKNSQFFSIKTKYIDPPSVPLYMMFEAEPKYAQLSIPDDVFRLNTKIEFIDPVSNSVIDEKSTRFQKAMLDAGFIFPADVIASNPTNRKPFDEGFFISDAQGYVFQLKMIKDEAVCVKTDIDPNLNIRQIFVKENLRKEFYGWILTQNNEVYLITYDKYELVQLPSTCSEEQYNYNADEMSYRFFTYPINKHIQIHGDGFIKMMVLDNDFQPIAEHLETWIPYAERPASLVKQFIFPFELFTYMPSKYVKLQIEFFWWQGLIGIGVSLLALVLFSRKRPWFDYVIVLFTGVFGLIGVLLIKPED